MALLLIPEFDQKVRMIKKSEHITEMLKNAESTEEIHYIEDVPVNIKRNILKTKIKNKVFQRTNGIVLFEKKDNACFSESELKYFERLLTRVKGKNEI